MKKFAALLICLAGTASADDFPALYNVTGLNDGDVLNVRTRATENGTVISSLPHDAKLVEVVAEDDGWGRVNVKGLSGWVPLSSMARQDGTELPKGYQYKCFGTEPFWSANVVNDSLTFTRPDDDDKVFQIGKLATAVSRDAPHALLGGKYGENITLVMQHEQCTDGMSDYVFGFGGTVVIGGYDTQVYTGCCSLDMN